LYSMFYGAFRNDQNDGIQKPKIGFYYFKVEVKCMYVHMYVCMHAAD
jgi:hypothetical protein